MPRETPYALTAQFFTGDAQKRQWAAFLNKNRLGNSEGFGATCQKIDRFSKPVFEAAVAGIAHHFDWKDGRWAQATHQRS